MAVPRGDHLSPNNARVPVMSQSAARFGPGGPAPRLRPDWSAPRVKHQYGVKLSALTGKSDNSKKREAPNAVGAGQGPIIGMTLNRLRSSPNWYITSATRWMRTESMAVG